MTSPASPPDASASAATMGHSPSEPELSFGLRVRNLTAAIGAMAGLALLFGFTGPLFSVVLDHQGVSGTLIGISTAVQMAAVFVVMAFVPGLIRRFGPARVMVAGSAISIAALVLMGLYVNVWAWFPLRFILGAAQAMAWTTGETWINHSSSDRARGRTIALFATAIAAGFSLGPFLQRFTGSEGDLPFIAACGAALIIALPPLLALKSEIRSHGAPSARLFQYVRLAPVPMFSNLSFAMIASALMALLPVYGLRLGMPDTEAVELIGWMGVGGIVMPLFVGYLADIMDRRLLLSWFIAVGLVAAALLPFIRDMEPLTWIFMMVFGGFRAGHYSLGVMLLGERFRGADLPSATAIFGVMYGAGSFVGPGLAGAGIDIWDPHGLPLIIAVMYLGFLPLPVIAYLKRRSMI